MRLAAASRAYAGAHARARYNNLLARREEGVVCTQWGGGGRVPQNVPELVNARAMKDSQSRDLAMRSTAELRRNLATAPGKRLDIISAEPPPMTQQERVAFPRVWLERGHRATGELWEPQGECTADIMGLR